MPQFGASLIIIIDDTS
jgi:hypothetical protein